MTKIVYNACYGGFGISEEGVRRYAEIKGISVYPEIDPKFPRLVTHYWLVPEGERPCILEGEAWTRATLDERIASNARYAELTLDPRKIKRTDPALVQAVEELGKAASARYANLQVAEIPDGSRYRIDEYDGYESVETPDSYEWEQA